MIVYLLVLVVGSIAGLVSGIVGTGATIHFTLPATELQGGSLPA